MASCLVTRLQRLTIESRSIRRPHLIADMVEHQPRLVDLSGQPAAGAVPGAIASDPLSPKSTIRLLGYSEDGVETIADASVDDIEPLRERTAVLWVDVVGIGDAETMLALGKLFNIHRLALEDIVHEQQRAKTDRYGANLFVVLFMPHLHGRRFRAEQVSIFVGDDFVITFQEETGDCFDGVRNRLHHGSGIIREAGPDYLMYAIVDSLIDGYYPILEYFGAQLEEFEDRMLGNRGPDFLDRALEIKRSLFIIRRVFWAHRDAVTALCNESMPLITNNTRIFLRDCRDHVAHILDLLSIYRELSIDLRDLHMSLNDRRLNETMRVLTIIATIFIPLTFVAGVYGMNFEFMPETKWAFGYPFALGLMGACTVVMLIIFRRLGWFDGGLR